MRRKATFVLFGLESTIQDYHSGILNKDNYEDYEDLSLQVFTPLTSAEDILNTANGCDYAVITQEEYEAFGGYLDRNEATNEEMMIELILNLHTMEAAMLRERIVSMMEITKQAIEEGGEGYASPFFSEKDWLNLHDKVQQYIGLKY
jgi:hypothetical protein